MTKAAEPEHTDARTFTAASTTLGRCRSPLRQLGRVLSALGPAGLALPLIGTVACAQPPGAVQEPQPTTKTTSWEELRPLADAYVCWMRGDPAEEFSPVLGDPGCRPTTADTTSPLAALVERTMPELIPILRLFMDQRGQELAQVCPAPQGTDTIAPATDCLREGFWADASLGGVVEQGLSIAVKSAGWECADCKVVSPTPGQTVSSDVIRPFVSAYIWPVESEDDGSVEIYVCSGANGASTTDQNPDYLRLGYLVAQGFVESDVLRTEIGRVAELGRTGALGIVEIRAELGRVLVSPAAERTLCEVAERFSWYTQVHLSDCDEQAQAASATAAR